MGMYSYVEDAEVRIIDKQGLTEFFSKIKNSKDGYYARYSELIDSDNDGSGFKIDDNVLDCSGIDGWKIIQYWYGEFLDFLRDLAIFVEGEIHLRYETDHEYANIKFKDGECIIGIGEIEWTDYTPDTLRNDKTRNDMHPELVSRLMVKKL